MAPHRPIRTSAADAPAIATAGAIPNPTTAPVSAIPIRTLRRLMASDSRPSGLCGVTDRRGKHRCQRPEGTIRKAGGKATEGSRRRDREQTGKVYAGRGRLVRRLGR